MRTHAHARHNKGTAPTNIACRPRGAGVPGFTPFNGDGVDTISFWIKNKGSPGSPVPVRVGASSFGLWLLQSNAALRRELHPIACCHLERRGASRSNHSSQYHEAAAGPCRGPAFKYSTCASPRTSPPTSAPPSGAGVRRPLQALQQPRAAAIRPPPGLLRCRGAVQEAGSQWPLASHERF